MIHPFISVQAASRATSPEHCHVVSQPTGRDSFSVRLPVWSILFSSPGSLQPITRSKRLYHLGDRLVCRCSGPLGAALVATGTPILTPADRPGMQYMTYLPFVTNTGSSECSEKTQPRLRMGTQLVVDLSGFPNNRKWKKVPYVPNPNPAE